MSSRFLNIDLDFFLDGIAYWPEGGRLSSEHYKPWSRDEVREFLERRCLLKPRGKIPGRLAKNHDAAFDYWEELRHQSETLFPLELVHVDAHADLGLGDASWRHIMEDVLRLPVSERPKAERGPHRLSLASYVAYAVACRWIKSIEYIHPPGGGDDLQSFLFREFSPSGGWLELKCFAREDVGAALRSGNVVKHLRAVQPISVEPSVPFRAVRAERWVASTPFDRAFLCQSPDYTPETSDALLGVFADYIDFT
ncbi:UPF0489 family protein [Myxococcus stipitatus]|uniref:UPF0489 family protein n=1 Tax=Myxococcus stipitatus TaxID=83455 RepID=UPI0030CE0888